MNDIWSITQSALEAAFPPEMVFAERFVGATKQAWPEEYIVHSLVYTRYDHFADNRKLSTVFFVDVEYFCKSVGQKARRVKEIIGTMEVAGFRTVNAGSDIPRDVGAVYYGVTMEFRYRSWG